MALSGNLKLENLGTGVNSLLIPASGELFTIRNFTVTNTSDDPAVLSILIDDGTTTIVWRDSWAIPGHTTREFNASVYLPELAELSVDCDLASGVDVMISYVKETTP